MKPTSCLFALLACAPLILHADFSYQETSKFSGGAMSGAIKMASIFSKKLREPMRSTVAVKGNKMLHGSDESTQIIDLDAETITDINKEKKTYAVITFAEMAEAMKAAVEKMGQAQQDAAKEGGQVQYKVSIRETGQTRDIAGYAAKEFEMKLETEVTDKKSGQSGSMDMLVNTWMAPKVSGYEEINEFYQRMAKKLAFTAAGIQLAAMGQAQMQSGLVKIKGEIAKMDGVPVLEVVHMGLMEGAAAQPQQQSAPPPSAKESIGGALGGAFGGFGGFGRKKKPKEEPKKEEPQQQQQAAQTGPASLMEMTVERTGFSSTALDAAQFQVPSGFSKVEHPMMRYTKK